MRPEILNPLFIPASNLPGIGPKTAKGLGRLFGNVEDGSQVRLLDLIFHLPFRVIDWRNKPKIADATEGEIQTFEVNVNKHYPPPRSNRRVPYRIEVDDATGEMALVYFRGDTRWLSKLLPEGETRFVSGRVEYFNGKMNMVHPDRVLTEQEFSVMPTVEPVYASTAGISQKVLSKAIQAALTKLPDLPEWIDQQLLERENWPSFQEALLKTHNPDPEIGLNPESNNRRRLAFDELLAGQIALGLLRNRITKSAGLSRKNSNRLVKKLSTLIPYQLTNAQTRSINEIKQDLEKPERMLRLLQGDVGSGKTIVALYSCIAVIEAGFQTCIMAPTELLARQHFASVENLCTKLGVRVELLIGKQTAAQRRLVLERIKSSEVDLVIGTHALFQNAVEFENLGLVVIDEQHRFGVHQRLALSDKGKSSEILVMTATPIPRTLVLTAYGDMDVSRLDEKPVGRQPIQTVAVTSDRFEELISRVSSALENGDKLYWICPLVEESAEIKATAAEDRFEHLKAQFGTCVGLLHGRMTVEQKNDAMVAFKDGDTKILVATTVVEVGVDVPDATIIVIEHAERFGLAQLHQLRGRVGRGSKKSTCILLYYAPLSNNAEARLKTMRETEDGFRIAEMDLKLRGEGEILGTRQSGSPGFDLAQMEFHSDILDFARNAAKYTLNMNPELKGPEGEAVRTLLYLFGQDQAIRLIGAG